MVLYGKTDEVTLSKNAPKVDLRVYVGTKKKPGKNGGETFGDDLVNRFRLEPKTPAIARAIKDLGVGDDLLVESLQITLAYGDPEKAYNCRAQKYSTRKDNLSGLLWECDRRNIYKEKIPRQTPFGIKNQFVDCQKPCPVAGTDDKCPQGCNDTGTLYFFLPELDRAGYTCMCSLVLSGEYNIRELSAKLATIKQQFGHIGIIPGMPFPFNSVVFDLGRYSAMRKHPTFENGKRSGKTTDKLTHLVSLDINPSWIDGYNKARKVVDLRSLGGKPSVKMIEQVFGGETMEATIVQSVLPPQISTGLLPSAWQMDKAKAKELMDLRVKHGWSESAYSELLYSYFQLGDRAQIMELGEQEFRQLKKYIVNPQKKQEFKIE